MRQYSTRTALFLLGVVISLSLAVSITFFFNRNMIALLKDREIDQITRFNEQTIDTIVRDSDYLAISLRDIAVQGEAFNFIEEQGPFSTKRFLSRNPLVLLRLNYAAMVGKNGFISERHFDYRKKIELTDVPLAQELQNLAIWLHRETQSNFDALGYGGNALDTLEHTQKSGFLGVEGMVFYFSAAPILAANNEVPPNGTLIFGRIISDDDLELLALSDKERKTGTTEMSVSLMDTRSLSKSGIGQIRYADSNQKIVLQNIIPTMDDSIVVLTTSQQRTMYYEGLSMIRALSLLVFVFSCALSFILLCMMEIWFIRPISTLSRKVATINYDLPLIDLPEFGGRELNILSNSIRELLHRVEEHKSYIEAQNSKLSLQNKMLHTLANYDPHTNLPNKNMFKNILRGKIADAKERDNIVAVMYMNVANIRLISDARGRETGDKVLIALANRLNSSFGMIEDNTVACFGRDNFALIIPAKNRDEVMMSAYSLISIFNEPFIIDAHEINVNVSVGIAIAPFDGDSFDELDACANIAMNNAGESSDSSAFLFFDHKQLETVISRYNRVDDIRNGLGRSEFKVVFQPKLDISSNMITSSEALVRWHSPSGLQSPAAFIKDACETGLIVPLSWEVLRMSFESNNRFRKELGSNFSVGVNVPNNVLLHSDFIPVLSDLLRETGMDPTHLNVELTEDVLVNDMKKCTSRMHALQRMGVQISIDDFGTGYASLQYLSKMPFDWMKIDKTFVDGLPDKPEEMAIIAASVGIARGLGMKVVLEGVETARQMDTIMEENYCDQIQGYVVSKPLYEDEFVSFVSDWNSKAKDRYQSLFYNNYGF